MVVGAAFVFIGVVAIGILGYRKRMRLINESADPQAESAL